MSAFLKEMRTARAEIQTLFNNVDESVAEVVDQLASDQDEFRISLLDSVRAGEDLVNKLENAIKKVKEQPPPPLSESVNHSYNYTRGKTTKVLPGYNDEEGGCGEMRENDEDIEWQKQQIAQSVLYTEEELQRLERELSVGARSLSESIEALSVKKEEHKNEKLMSALYRALLGLEWEHTGPLWKSLKDKRRLFKPSDPELMSAATMPGLLVLSGCHQQSPAMFNFTAKHFSAAAQEDPSSQCMFATLSNKIWESMAATYFGEEGQLSGR
eukprot:GHVH01001617.1.p1 GENE.GHVH01001617.1~~GHVH01001617.1.p1  ORF type:complete len:270 (+),score=55.07 GHVH01001617.1:226-1035(+)